MQDNVKIHQSRKYTFSLFYAASDSVSVPPLLCNEENGFNNDNLCVDTAATMPLTATCINRTGDHSTPDPMFVLFIYLICMYTIFLSFTNKANLT